MNVNAHKFQSSYELVCKSLAWSNHRTTLPQSALRAASSLREGAGATPPITSITRPLDISSAGGWFFGFVWGYILPFNRVLAKPWGYGRFSSPLRNSGTVSLYHSTDDTPSASHSLSSSLREGAGNGLYHSTYRPETVGFRAIFIAPTEAQKILHSTAHRGAAVGGT